MTFLAFSARVAAVQAQIAAACQAAGRSPSDVKLLPVTKTHPAWAVDFAVRAGFSAIGENRVQEAASKQPLCTEKADWELIGHLQSNKARLAVAHFQRVQSVDSAKLARLLDQAAAQQGRTLRVLLQINAGDDPAKFGADRSDAPALLEAALACPHLRVEGLMTIAPLSDDPAVADRTFNTLRELRDELASRFSHPLPELSMGMSGDLASAIRAGSTLVRVGTALYGHREPRP